MTTAPSSAIAQHLAARFKRGDTQPRVVLSTAARSRDVHNLDVAKLVYPFTGPGHDSQDAAVLTAMAWAIFHQKFTGPVDSPGTNLGAALRRLPEPDRDRLFQPFVTATPRALCEHLVPVMTALADARSIPGWGQLQFDLFWFIAYSRNRVLRRWASSMYYQPTAKATTDPATAETAIQEEINA